MRVKKLLLLFFSAVLTVSLLTACCDFTYSRKLGTAINNAQSTLDFSHSRQLDRTLQKTLAGCQAGEDISVIRDRLIAELGLEDAVCFSPSGIRNAHDGQHAVQVFRIEGGTSDSAIDQFSAQIVDILKSLSSDGKYNGVVSMIEKDGAYYAAVNLYVIQSGTTGGTLTGIAVKTPPAKTVYYVNEVFDKTGMQITATFGDGFTLDVTNACDIPSTKFESAGKQQVTITYKGQTTTAAVDVFGLQSITVTSDPAKTAYTTGETFETAGIVLTATYSDGASAITVTNITNNITASTEAFTTPNDKTPVTITYTNEHGQTASTKVFVKVSPVSIESDDDYEIPANVVASLENTFKNKTAAITGYTVDTQLDPAIQSRLNKAMEAYAASNYNAQNGGKTYLRDYGIPVLDLTNEFQVTSELNQVEKYYYLGGIEKERRASEANDIWNTLPGSIDDQIRSLSRILVGDEADPYATNSYRFYINLSASKYYSEKYSCDMLKVKMAIIVERIRTPKQ